MPIPEFYSVLFRKYLENDCSPEQVEELFLLMKEPEYKEHTLDLIELHAGIDQQELPVDAALKERLARRLQTILTEAPVVPIPKKNWFARVAVAASILILFSSAAYFLFVKKTQKEFSQNKPAVNNDVAAPTGTKTTLTLANGSTIILDSAQNGTLAEQGNTSVQKLNNSQLAYNTLNEKPAEVVYNTLSTAKGGQTMVVLADGTKVWLNAMSSLKFPTAFLGKDREVELTGEAYFEVAKNVKMPFHVKVNDMEVEVLGTHFNVNAYDDDSSIKTTLLEGSVKITRNKEFKILKPGEQAIVDHANGHVQVKTDGDAEAAIAWKNGLFEFAGLDMEGVRRQLERWYDVDVQYDGKIPGGHFSGIVSRSSNISQVLKIMEAADVHFKIEGNKIMVLP